jgi:hypothetical protein
MILYSDVIEKRHEEANLECIVFFSLEAIVQL